MTVENRVSRRALFPGIKRLFTYEYDLQRKAKESKEQSLGEIPTTRRRFSKATFFATLSAVFFTATLTNVSQELEMEIPPFFNSPDIPPASENPFTNESQKSLKVLTEILSNVRSSDWSIYGLRDDLGNSMDTLKIIQIPEKPDLCLGVYHYISEITGEYEVGLATSAADDLQKWHHEHVLYSGNATNPRLIRKSNGEFVLAVEKRKTLLGFHIASNIALKRYKNIETLLDAKDDKSIILPRSRKWNLFYEGTPSFEKITVNPITGNEEIILRYHRGGGRLMSDEQGYGLLSNFNKWSGGPDIRLNNEFHMFKVKRIGGRDLIDFNGQPYHIFEGSRDDNSFSSFGSFLKLGELIKQLYILTDGGSISFGNMTATVLFDGTIVVTVYIFGEGAALNEQGELIYCIKSETQIKIADSLSLASNSVKL